MVKIYVQGHEYEVLFDMQNVLDNAIIIELEARLLPIYNNQKLFSYIIALLELCDFGLCSSYPQRNFDWCSIDVNALFLKRDSRHENETYKEERNFLCKFLGINKSFGGEALIKHLQ